MKTIWLCLVAVFLVSPCISQEHAPTADQCKADQAVWGADYAVTEYYKAEDRHLQEGTPNRTDIAQLTITQLKQRSNEMYQCKEVVSVQPYRETARFYHDVLNDRLLSFLTRHGLIEQLMQEDAAGKR